MLSTEPSPRNNVTDSVRDWGMDEMRRVHPVGAVRRVAETIDINVVLCAKQPAVLADAGQRAIGIAVSSGKRRSRSLLSRPGRATWLVSITRSSPIRTPVTMTISSLDSSPICSYCIFCFISERWLR